LSLEIATAPKTHSKCANQHAAVRPHDARVRARFRGPIAFRAGARFLVIRAVLATLIMIALFFAGVVPAKAAVVIGGLLLLTRRVKSRRVYALCAHA
jgi:hypothetical protein